MLKRLLPLIVFVALALLLLSGIWMRKRDEALGRNPSDIPSPLIGKKAPVFSLPALHDPQKLVSNTEFAGARSEEHTSELQSLMRISYAVFCLKKKTHKYKQRRLKTKS